MIAPVSLLFVPGSAPERFGKALATDAGMICLDLEDAVAPADKKRARETVIAFMAICDERDRLCIRINRLSSPEGTEDLAALARASVLATLMMPKVEVSRDVEIVSQIVAQHPQVPIIALLESPRGVEAAFDIAACPAVAMLMFGSFDYAAECGCTQDWDVLAPVRTRIVAAASSVAKGAIDSPAVDLVDVSANATEARRARQAGFAGKAAIHPRMVAGIHGAFAIDEATRAEAEAIVAAFDASGGGVARLNGKLVEKPVILRMRRLLGLSSAEH